MRHNLPPQVDTKRQRSRLTSGSAPPPLSGYLQTACAEHTPKTGVRKATTPFAFLMSVQEIETAIAQLPPQGRPRN